MRGWASQGYRAAGRALADQGVSILRDPNAGWIAGLQTRHWIAGPQNRLWTAETYVLSIGGNTYTVDYSGLDASGNRSTTTLTKA